MSAVKCYVKHALTNEEFLLFAHNILSSNLGIFCIDKKAARYDVTYWLLSTRKILACRDVIIHKCHLVSSVTD